MELKTTINVNDNPNPMFNELLATLTGDDGTTGSISMLVGPVRSAGGDPEALGIRTSQYVQFEHEGRVGRFDLAEVFTDWVTAIGDRPPTRERELTEEESAERRHQRLVERRREAGA
jgi:hypothetical protein